MSESDLIKEKIAYYKFWLGIMVITDISLFGWLISNFISAPLMIAGGCIMTIYFITGGIVATHRSIERHIEKLRNL
jgi:hypothetical protein